MPLPGTRYQRILLKLSGEALSGGHGFGIDAETLSTVCAEVCAVVDLGVQVAVVIGGGNYFRGGTQSTMERAPADYIGMLGTVMNALTLQQEFARVGTEARVQSAIPMSPICEPYVRGRALKHLQRGRVVLFAAGTGNPFFTTDTAASLRAIEIGADVLLKATQVDGVYDHDPKQVPGAQRYERVSYDEVLSLRLGVMDATAIALCREHELPLRVFALGDGGSLQRIVSGSGDDGTLVCNEVRI